MTLNLPIEERVHQLLEHLQIESAHFAARLFDDWHGLVTRYPGKIASLTLACPSIDIEALKPLTSRLLVFSGDQPLAGTQTLDAMQHLPNASHVIFPDYGTFLWTDMVQDHTAQMGTEMLDFMAQFDASSIDTSLITNRGEVAGITYEIYGTGEPLILLPLGLAPSGWSPLIDKLSQHYCVINLGGAVLGVIPMLEHRGTSHGYTKMVRNMFNELALKPGQAILDVGSGTGVIERWLAHETAGQNPITGMDLNDYLLKEAMALTEKAQAEASYTLPITYEKGNAEALPFPDNSFDVAFSITVMEEVDADQMLAEMIRVVKPGGRVGVIVRGTDMPIYINIPTPSDLKARFETPRLIDEGTGCASATLYSRFQKSPLTNVRYGPQFVVLTEAQGFTERFIQGSFRSQLTLEETVAWQAAIDEAAAAGTFYIAWPHHCAVGQKPS